MLDRVMDRLRDEFVQQGRLDHFNRLKAFLLDRAETPYATLAREMGTSEGALKVAIHRLRKRYRELFRQEIAETVAEQQNTVDPSIIGTPNDYQLARAVDMLRGIALFNGRVIN